MNRVLYIDDSFEYVRTALTEDGKLCEIHIEAKKSSGQAESLFYGRIQSIRSSIGAVFVDIGDDLNAFLPLEDGINLRCGQMVIVQGVAKQTTETKGLRVSMKINLPGKWLVLLPRGKGVHVSKKVKDQHLRSMLSDVGVRICPPDCGLIVRTASEEVTEELLCEEAESLYALWKSIAARADGMTKPGIVHRREPLHVRMVRDLHSLSRIVVNTQSCLRELQHEKDTNRISQDTAIEPYEEQSQLIFDYFGIEAQIDKALKKRVWLPCGGYLIIDCCEALTVIDVNSGKMMLGRDLEETALKVNLEAADEIARQLRLRDIGGVIVVDFIDMKLTENRGALISRMKQAAAADRSKVSIEGLTKLGLLEMTRKRVHAQLNKTLKTSCSYCSGMSEVFSADEIARRALRQIRRQAIGGQRGPFVVHCAPAAAFALQAMQNPLMHTPIYVDGISGRHAERFDIEQIGEGVPVPKGAVALRKNSDL